jgi:hypothetical protein
MVKRDLAWTLILTVRVLVIVGLIFMLWLMWR